MISWEFCGELKGFSTVLILRALSQPHLGPYKALSVTNPQLALC